ncbi:hypothetical protein J40TS1_20160 [Paenibacillus montaniterrae]|uniref:rRNA methyltransferase AviRa n=1 Tax=Paenibacillus montaniterrae TaxID=429341 RepID=A0A920CYU5_9BACL|nr:hypothetical protein [Paenibacillus montaniterrae]GIP16374.1 hypothetical protein J40TS1_20160 [Paenibacillus montaniterrae]
MKYIYETNKTSYEDFASGRVLYNAHGTTSFPVRLASEIIQRCFQILEAKGSKGPYSLYDPCCGGAYLLTVIGLLHHDKIKSIFASDINDDALRIAEKNLSLLSINGLNKRKQQIKQYIQLYNKASHISALESAERLSQLISDSNIEQVSAFQSDVTASTHNSSIPDKINIVMTDLPYGDIVTWRSNSPDPLADFFANVFESLDPSHSVLAVIADKGQKLKHEKFKRLELVKIGKRQMVIFEPIVD